MKMKSSNTWIHNSSSYWESLNNTPGAGRFGSCRISIPLHFHCNFESLFHFTVNQFRFESCRRLVVVILSSGVVFQFKHEVLPPTSKSVFPIGESCFVLLLQFLGAAYSNALERSPHRQAFSRLNTSFLRCTELVCCPKCFCFYICIV
ncbi:hypothetical protein DEO72_LG6g819 [Vigna unguiculata]|uniref:Uncharacterized protein n=1 Tax=Vigna unguiculata TaxID=3917 RepID=A0A4D6M5K4_VIGUN|nr:hypothetical protein DEO72_LG6g819 [Vigna unguiculata]